MKKVFLFLQVVLMSAAVQAQVVVCQGLEKDVPFVLQIDLNSKQSLFKSAAGESILGTLSDKGESVRQSVYDTDVDLVENHLEFELDKKTLKLKIHRLSIYQDCPSTYASMMTNYFEAVSCSVAK